LIKLRPFIVTIGIFLISILVNLIIQGIIPAAYRQVESSDYVATYRPTAMNLLAGNGYSLNSGQLVTFFPPGYSIILAAWFRLSQSILSEISAIFILNLIAGGMISALIYHLASQVFGVAAGLLAALLWLTYPFYLWLLGSPNTELPFLVFFLVSFACFWAAVYTNQPGCRMAFLFSAGFMQAIALLIRPIVIGMWILWCGFWLVWKINTTKSSLLKTLSELCVFLSGLAFLIIPWEVTVYRQTGEIIPVSTAGPVGILDGLTFGILSKGYRQDLKLSPDIKNLMEKFNEMDEGSSPSDFYDLAIHNPGAFSKLILLKALRSWYATDSARYENLILPIQLVYLGLILWGLIAAWRSRGRPRLYASFVVLTSLYFWLATTSALSILRYMMPAMCLLMTIIPAGIFQFPLLKKYAKG
jgi:4-amino-4-deoxy-L-arabinose transferase-like glycosyltransferase